MTERPLDVSMEENLGSKQQVLSTNSPPPLRGRNRDHRSISLGDPGIGGYQALGPRGMPAQAGHFPPLIGGSRQDLLSPLLRVFMPPPPSGGH